MSDEMFKPATQAEINSISEANSSLREAFEAWIRKTDLIGVSWPNTYFIQWLNEAYLAGAAWQKQQCEDEIAEQCRIIGMSGERELDHLAEIARLNERLESNHVYDIEGSRQDVEPGSIPDGIECRDMTIVEQDKLIDKQWEEIARLRGALLDMVWQFCSDGEKLSHSFMSAEEYAFSVLDLENGMTYEQAEKQALKGADDDR